MTRERFKLVHSELIMQVQMIENDLRFIYASMKAGTFEDNYDDLEQANLGKIIRTLKELDYSDGLPELLGKDYETLNEIREIRNYWCHQCYLDYVYIADDYKREREFQIIADRLCRDENRTWVCHEKMENLRIKCVKKYR